MKRIEAPKTAQNYFLISAEDELIGTIDFSKHYLKFIFQTDVNKFYEVVKKNVDEGGSCK